MENDTIVDENNNMSTTLQNRTEAILDVQSLAKFYVTYKIGVFINNYYFPVFIPIGIMGNILSFLVMIQGHNRHMSMSLYLASTAVSDTIVLLIGLVTYLNNVHNVHFPPNLYWFCTAGNFVLFASFLCSTLLIVSMTFGRFYSIIRPHKAASFNTVKRAKVTIVCIVIFSYLYNIPHLFISSISGTQCLPYGAALGKFYGEFYYWFSLVVSYSLPFVLLLATNSVIIHTLRIRSTFIIKHEPTQGEQGQGQSQGQISKLKNSDKQIFAILFLVTFGFLILTTPANLLFLFIMIVDFTTSPGLFAGYYLFYNIAQKLYYTNHGINFFLYVISGQKFRSDLARVFSCTAEKQNGSSFSQSTLTETRYI